MCRPVVPRTLHLKYRTPENKFYQIAASTSHLVPLTWSTTLATIVGAIRTNFLMNLPAPPSIRVVEAISRISVPSHRERVLGLSSPDVDQLAPHFRIAIWSREQCQSNRIPPSLEPPMVRMERRWHSIPIKSTLRRCRWMSRFIFRTQVSSPCAAGREEWTCRSSSAANSARRRCSVLAADPPFV
jgi:hypothetical protein